MVLLHSVSKPGGTISIPGKSFLLGEYLALAGGPSIVANTGPCFEFSWELADRSPNSVTKAIRHPFHDASPAGKLLNAISVDAGVSVRFKDPFQGRGGLGASTAEFAGAWIFRRWLERPDEWSTASSVVTTLSDRHETIAPIWKSERFGSNRFRDILNDYHSTGAKGSGADLVSQVTGGIAVWDATTDEMRRFRWPFQDLRLTLLATGKKLATHEHLAGLEPLQPSTIEEMRLWVEDAIQSFALEDADRLVASVRGFGKILAETGRVADHSHAWLEELADCAGVRAAKGCGAMGSDILLVLHDRSSVSQVDSFAAAHGLERAGRDSDICMSGLSISLTAAHELEFST